MKLETSSRLHFGIIDLSRKFVREYGALGVMIEGGYQIDISPCKGGSDIQGDEHIVKEVKAVHKRLDERYDLKSGYEIKVLRQVPRHIGLGSTTQLHMGIGAGILRSEGIEVSLKELAMAVGRSRYSAIGTYGFKHGGFILEGGKAYPDEIPPLTARYDVPEDWRFLIVCPKDIQSYDEDDEKPIMEELKVDPMYPRQISHHIIMGMLPALKSKDIEDFGYHLSKIQHLVGESFSGYQGGVFHPAIEDVIHKMDDITYGAGQSSWGPTAYGLIDVDNADIVKEKMEHWLRKQGMDAYLWLAKPVNHGVLIG